MESAGLAMQTLLDGRDMDETYSNCTYGPGITDSVTDYVTAQIITRGGTHNP